jgi:hypothetical protein
MHHVAQTNGLVATGRHPDQLEVVEDLEKGL